MFPNKKESILLTLSLIVVQLLIGIYLGVVGVQWEAGNPIVYIMVSTLSTAVIVWFSLRKMKLKFDQLFHAKFNSIASVLTVILVPSILVVVGAQIILSNFFNAYYSIFPSETVFTQEINALLGSGFLGFLSVCLIAPIVEEIVFRGIILRGLLGNYKNGQAIFISSALFSLYHINPDQLVHALLIGGFFGWLYVKTYSLWPSIIAHILFNLVAFLLSTSNIQLEGINYFPNNEIVYPSILFQLIGFGSAFLGLLLLNGTFKNGGMS